MIRLFCCTLRLSSALMASTLARVLLQPSAMATNAATATTASASINPVRTLILLNIFSLFR
ncbi:hypothetical protein AD428_02360 [Achromobacter sp. DMS1]|nr:hypothetical protein AD428_02360 [Achromobacter sp. DMS1]